MASPPAPAPRRRGVRVPGRLVSSRPFRAVAPHVVPRAHRLLHRISGGRTLLATRSQPLLVLVTTGARSGERRETPLAGVPRTGGGWLVVGSNFARDRHPAWTGNLLHQPAAEVVHRGTSTAVTARLLEPAEREEIWPALLQWFPGWDDYTDITDREFRVFELIPTA